jgi:hypothetical protein
LARDICQDPVQRAAVIQAFSKSISTIFLVNAPVIGFCFLLCKTFSVVDWIFSAQSRTALLLRHYTLERQVVFGTGAPATSGAESADQPRSAEEAGSELHIDEKRTDGDATERV